MNRVHHVKLTEEEEKLLEKENIELQHDLEQYPVFKLNQGGVIDNICNKLDGVSMIWLAASSFRFRNGMMEHSKKFEKFNKRLDLCDLRIKANKCTINDIYNALPNLEIIKLGQIGTTKVFRYLKRFNELRQINIPLRSNHYFSKDLIYVNTIKIYNIDGTTKNILFLLEKVTNLRVLTLRNVRITEEILKAMERHPIQRLYLINCIQNFDCRSYSSIANLRLLTHLKVINTTWVVGMRKFLQDYLKEMPHARLIYLNITYVINNAPPLKLRRLEDLRIHFSVLHIRAFDLDIIKTIQKTLNIPDITLIQHDSLIGDREQVEWAIKFLSQALRFCPNLKFKMY